MILSSGIPDKRDKVNKLLKVAVDPGKETVPKKTASLPSLIYRS